MKVISNSSPLIALSSIKELDLIRRLWGHIIIPRAIFKESVVAGNKKPGSSEIAGACTSWIKVTRMAQPEILFHDVSHLRNLFIPFLFIGGSRTVLEIIRIAFGSGSEGCVPGSLS